MFTEEQRDERKEDVNFGSRSRETIEGRKERKKEKIFF